MSAKSTRRRRRRKRERELVKAVKRILLSDNTPPLNRAYMTVGYYQDIAEYLSSTSKP